VNVDSDEGESCSGSDWDSPEPSPPSSPRLAAHKAASGVRCCTCNPAVERLMSNHKLETCPGPVNKVCNTDVIAASRRSSGEGAQHHGGHRGRWHPQGVAGLRGQAGAFHARAGPVRCWRPCCIAQMPSAPPRACARSPSVGCTLNKAVTHRLVVHHCAVVKPPATAAAPPAPPAPKPDFDLKQDYYQADLDAGDGWCTRWQLTA
jgi:hypothetical protein